MKIHSLTLSNVRGVEHLELTDLPETGVIVIEGDNEAGKSTIMDAINVVLTQPHNAKNKETKPLEPKGKDGVAPQVRLAASVGPYEFEITKQWIKRPKSELRITAPTPAQFTGREADNELKRILEDNVDPELMSTLFMRQDDQQQAVNAVGIKTVTEVLDRDSGEGVAGTEDTALTKAIEAEYDTYFTAKGRKKAVLTDPEKRLEELTLQLADKQAEARALDGYVDEVTRREQDMAEAEAELPAAEEKVIEAEEAFDKASEAVREQESARERVDAAKLAVQHVNEEVERRKELSERLTKAQATHTRLEKEHDKHAEAAAAEAEKVTELTVVLDAATTKREETREALKSARATRDVVRASVRLHALRDLLVRISEADQRIAALRETMPEHPVDSDYVRALEAATNDLEVQRTIRAAGAAKLVVTRAGSEPIAIDGTEVAGDAGTELELHTGTELSVGEFTAEFRSAKGTKDSSTSVTKAEEKLAELLAEYGCTDVDHARALRDEHQEQARALRDAQDQRRTLLGNDDVDELEAEATRLEKTVGETEAPELSEAEAEEQVTAAEKADAETEKAVERAQAELTSWTAGEAATKLQVAAAKLEGAARDVENARLDIEAAEKKRGGDELDAEAEKAQTDVAEAEAALAAATEVVANAQPELAEQLLEGARNRVKAVQDRAHQAELRIGVLTGYIERAAGIGEQVDKLEAQVEAQTTVLDRLQRRADAVQLLYTTMDKHRVAARERYAAPFAQALSNYASFVFGPDVSFNLNEKLEVVERTLNGTTIELSELSGGAKEQLAVLTRFAIADLVARDESDPSSAPVFIDDALGATDPERLQLMNALFTKVSKNNQVFVLTCFPRRYDTVTTAARHSIESLKQTGA